MFSIAADCLCEEAYQPESNSTRSFQFFLVTATCVNCSLPCLNEQTHPDGLVGRDLLQSDETVCPSQLPTSSDSCSSQPSGTLVISQSGFLQVSCVVINALTILDIVLSRRTKPWRFVLRVLYRFGRSNLQWGLLWATFQLWSQLEGDQIPDKIEVALNQQSFTAVLHQLQQLWTVLLANPVLLTMAFIVYNLMASWVLHRLIRRNDDHNVMATDDSLHPSPSPIDGARNVSRRVLSGWSLMIDCLFRPLSLDTANSLVDFEMDENLERLIERLALPNLWLTPTVPSDYLKYLPVWRFENWSRNIGGLISPSTSCNNVGIEPKDNGTYSSSIHSLDEDRSSPNNMKWIPSVDCAICLDKYNYTVNVCGLPCGHQFHHNCIMVWLQRDNHHCPICRWPAYQNKYLSIM